MRLEQVVQPSRPGSLFQGHMQLSSQPMQEIERSAGFGFDDRFHHQLAGAIQNRNCNGFLVNIQADILHLATQHAEYILEEEGDASLRPLPPKVKCHLFRTPCKNPPLSLRSRMSLD